MNLTLPTIDKVIEGDTHSAWIDMNTLTSMYFSPIRLGTNRSPEASLLFLISSPASRSPQGIPVTLALHTLSSSVLMILQTRLVTHSIKTRIYITCIFANAVTQTMSETS